MGRLAMSNKIKFTQIKRLVMAPVIMFAVAGIGTADAARVPFQSYLTGTFIAQGAPVDTNQDGINAHLVLAEGKDPRFGNVSYQGIAEFEKDGMPTVCRNGNPGLAQSLVEGAVIIRTAGGGLIRTRTISGRACLDAITRRTVFVRFNSAIVGGTGKFVGAKGNVTTDATVNIMLGDTSRDESFGGMTATNRGTIITRSR